MSAVLRWVQCGVCGIQVDIQDRLRQITDFKSIELQVEAIACETLVNICGHSFGCTLIAEGALDVFSIHGCTK